MLVDTLVLLPVGGVVIAMILPESSTNSLLGPYIVCTIGTRRLATDPALLCVGLLPIHGGGPVLLVLQLSLDRCCRLGRLAAVYTIYPILACLKVLTHGKISYKTFLIPVKYLKRQLSEFITKKLCQI